MPAPAVPADRLLRIDEVQSLTSLGRTKIYGMVRRGDFPAPIPLSPRCARWSESEVQAWIAARRDAAR